MSYKKQLENYIKITEINSAFDKETIGRSLKQIDLHKKQIALSKESIALNNVQIKSAKKSLLKCKSK